jgi:hypothetical protein
LVLQPFGCVAAEGLVVPVGAPGAGELERSRQTASSVQRAERRKEESTGEFTGGAEQDEAIDHGSLTTSRRLPATCSDVPPLRRISVAI